MPPAPGGRASHPPAAAAMATATPRRRHPSTMAADAGGEWAAVSASSAGEGTWRVEALGKQQLMRRTGLRVRDLRALLDPAAQLSHPTSVMGRDRAVVFNLHRVRAVITASEVLVPAPRDPSVAPLVGELHARLAAAAAAAAAAASPPEEDGKALPFEFRALEVCLDFACKSLDHETSMLEKEAYPALDALTFKVTTLNLEHVRQLKSRLLAISGGVHKARDELEHLLDDDADMTAMHLSEKLAFFQAAAGQSSRFDIEEEPGEFDHQSEDDQAAEREEDDEGEGSVPFSPKIDELEKLLEAYFVQIDGTLNKLSTLREYVEDTEDYINLMLDDKQNQLLQMGVVLSTAALVLTAAIAATGVFAINIHFALYRTTNTSTFWVATAGILGAAAVLFVAAIVYYRKKGILR